MKKKSSVPIRRWKVSAVNGGNSIAKSVKAVDAATAVMKVLDSSDDLCGLNGGIVTVVNDRGESESHKIDIDLVGYTRDEYQETVIETGCCGIAVVLGKPDKEGVRSGVIYSNLKDDTNEDEDIWYRSAVDGIESLILAHACAGIDISSPEYLEGIETAIDALANNAD